MRQLPRRSTHLSAIQARTMTDEDMIALVQEYFAGVDNEDIDRVLSTLTEDCRFTVETHQVELIGHGEIKGMFERLWQNHSAVRHHAFTYVPSAERGQIAAQFQVTNTLRDRSEVHKSNCNFFRLLGGGSLPTVPAPLETRNHLIADARHRRSVHRRIADLIWTARECTFLTLLGPKPTATDQH